MINFFKQNWGKIVVAIVMLWLTFHDSWFWAVLLFGGIGVYLVLNRPIPERLRKVISISIWSAFVVSLALGYYANHYFPHGPMIDTGDVVCQNDDRGPCGEKFIEDTRNLNVPDWVKFFRTSEGEFLWLGLAFAGILVSYKNKKEE